MEKRSDIAREPAALGIAGVARHGATILRAIRASGGCRLAACYDIDPEARNAAAKEYACRAAGAYEELLADPALEGIVIVTPNHLHRAQTLAALEAGKHVFVEKPLALNVPECSDIVAAAKRAGRIVQVGHNTRKRRVFRKAKELLAAGALGRIVACHAHISFDFGLRSPIPEWKKDPEKCPLLPMTQLGIHFIDTMNHLIAPIRSVSCVASSAAMKRGAEIPVVDSVAALLRFENGALGTIQSHYVTPPTYEILLYGDEGKCACFEDRIELTRWKGTGYGDEVISCLEPDGASFLEEMEEFARAIRTGAKPETGAKAGLANVAVIDAMRKSILEKRMVEITETSVAS